MTRRHRKMPMISRNIFALWIGILLLSVIHMFWAVTEEILIEQRQHMDVYNDKNMSMNQRLKWINDNEQFVTVYRNVSNIEVNNNNNSKNADNRFKGEFGKQHAFERTKLDIYHNTSRPMTCDNCFQNYFKFESSSICNSTGFYDKVDIIILIPSAYTHVRQRMTLRTTWLTRTKKNTAKVRYAFILGQAGSKQMQLGALKEQRMYNDMVLANFSDTYANLTLKTLAAFHWVNTWCPQTRIIVKADDDVYINLDNLINFVSKNLRFMDNSVFGGCWKRVTIRDRDSKYYVSNTTYPNSTFPETCSGTMYVTGIKVITRVLKVSPSIPFFHLEDVYVGFCMEKLGIKARTQIGILTKAIKADMPLCVFKGSQLISGHVKHPRKIEQIWKTQCNKKTGDKKQK
ncbi:hypothetical protein ACF0H5_006097 [Mactra antiquata]